MTNRAEEIAGDGPYRVEKSSGVYVIIGPNGRWPFHFSHESTAKVRADDFNKVYKQGQQDRWISVSERLPEKGVTVLVLGPSEDGDGIGLDALDPDSDGATWIEWSNAHERYISCGVHESVGPGEEAKYTHWSPTPP